MRFVHFHIVILNLFEELHLLLQVLLNLLLEAVLQLRFFLLVLGFLGANELELLLHQSLDLSLQLINILLVHATSLFQAFALLKVLLLFLHQVLVLSLVPVPFLDQMLLGLESALKQEVRRKALL